MPLITQTLSDYLPVYFQAVLGASPITSGIDALPTSLFISLSALVAGILVQVTKRYRLINLLGWIITIAGLGVLSLLRGHELVGRWVGFQFVAAAGTGIIVSTIHQHYIITMD